ncbi:MAG: PHB depolymerase family esterase [Gemmatimonadales bacterium]|nr:PHB depolymerase family esterase [Gemmatimonadales bacterium]
MIRHDLTPARLQLLLLVLLSIVPAVPTHGQVRTLTHDGEKRRFIVHLPLSYSSNEDQRYPVVLNFHGGGMTMAEQMMYTRMNDASDRHDFIVVYPQGLGQDWNVGFETSYQDGNDDVGFVAALLDRLEADFRIDGTRVYAAGLSRGGFFTHRLAAELSHRVAAIAAVGAPLPVPVETLQQPRGERSAVGVMIVHGTADRVVDYLGKEGSYLSAADSRAYWARRHGLGGAAETTRQLDEDPYDSTSVTILEAGSGHHAVALVTIHNGGHTWAGADPFNVGLPIGRTSREVDLNEVIWHFLAAHRRQ